MQLIRENSPYEDYLAAQSPVNSDEPRVSFVAEHLMGRLANLMEIRTERTGPIRRPPWFA